MNIFSYDGLLVPVSGLGSQLYGPTETELDSTLASTLEV